MNELEATQYVEAKEEKIFTTSRKVAERFKKEHTYVLKRIRNLIPKVNGGTFDQIKYIDDKGEAHEEYLLDRKSFMLLAMRFTGDVALQTQIAFVDAFDKMENYIRKQHRAVPTELTIDQKIDLALLAEKDTRKSLVLIKTELQEVKNLAIQASSHNSANTGFMTVRGFCNVRKIKMDQKTANKFGRACSSASRGHGTDIRKTDDERYGTTNSYRIGILEDVYKDMFQTQTQLSEAN